MVPIEMSALVDLHTIGLSCTVWQQNTTWQTMLLYRFGLFESGWHVQNIDAASEPAESVQH